MMKFLALVAALALASCSDKDARPSATVLAKSYMDPSRWTPGPTVLVRQGEAPVNVSAGTGPPRLHADGWSFSIPQPTNARHVNYVTTPVATLTGKTRLRLRFRVEAAPGVKLYGKACPDKPTRITLYIQRRGDDWSGVGEFQTYRWWAKGHRLEAPIIGKDYEIIAPFDGVWGAVQGGVTNSSSPDRWRSALTNAGTIGFTFGDCTGAGHGAFATGPAQFVVTYFGAE